MSTEKCPKCGSYNTSKNAFHYIKRGSAIALGFAAKAVIGIVTQGQYADNVKPGRATKVVDDEYTCKSCGCDFAITTEGEKVIR